MPIPGSDFLGQGNNNYVDSNFRMRTTSFAVNIISYIPNLVDRLACLWAVAIHLENALKRYQMLIMKGNIFVEMFLVHA